MSDALPAYLIAFIDVHNPDGYAAYRPLAASTVAHHGGRFMVRGGQIEALEGEAPARVVVIEFPSMDAARGWYHSPEYQEAAAIRQATSTGQLFFVTGSPPA